MIVNAWYVSVWDGGFEVKTPCLFDEENMRCYGIRQVDYDALDVDQFDAEFIELKDGTRMWKDDGVVFDY